MPTLPSETERDYLWEAVQIVKHQTILLPEREHLEAIYRVAAAWHDDTCAGCRFCLAMRVAGVLNDPAEPAS